MKKSKKGAYTTKELEFIYKLKSNGMDGIRAEWYLHAMQTWTKEDYNNSDTFHMAMMGAGQPKKTLES